MQWIDIGYMVMLWMDIRQCYRWIYSNAMDGYTAMLWMVYGNAIDGYTVMLWMDIW